MHSWTPVDQKTGSSQDRGALFPVASTAQCGRARPVEHRRRHCTPPLPRRVHRFPSVQREKKKLKGGKHKIEKHYEDDHKNCKSPAFQHSFPAQCSTKTENRLQCTHSSLPAGVAPDLCVQYHRWPATCLDSLAVHFIFGQPVRSSVF